MQIKPIQVKIAYWTSDTIEFTEKTLSGKLTILNNKIILHDKDRACEILYSELIEYELRKLNKVGTYVHLKTNAKIINFVIPRINIANLFLINNYLKTKNIFEIIMKNVCLVKG